MVNEVVSLLSDLQVSAINLAKQDKGLLVGFDGVVGYKVEVKCEWQHKDDLIHEQIK